MTKLFGTDGIRGKAGAFPLDAKTMREVGFLLGTYLHEESGRVARVIIGRDTRESGPWIERAIIEGIGAAGGESVSVGVMTTPGIAFLTRVNSMDAGIVVSASHNPYLDNGIKVFLPSGRKLPETVESFIESKIGSSEIQDSSETVSKINPEDPDRFESQYEEHILDIFSGLSLSGMRVAIDCANGASSKIAPRIFESLGAEVFVIGASPNGRNINEGCGSLHMDGLCALVKEKGADLGIAYDGDADRALLCDSSGAIVDGDGILWVVAREMLASGRLETKSVVATVMTNIGLELAFKELGIELVRTDVGDKYVLDELMRNGGEIGGEQSGHVIFPETSLVGDGIVTSLKVIEVLARRGVSMGDALRGFARYPQVLKNIRVFSKPPFDTIISISDAIDSASTQLMGRGRILVRYSGTENLARVMIEGDDLTMIEKLSETVSDAIREAIGV